ncbi:MAG: hypothetical protein ABSG63_18920 [Spirochaetia bacterium]
MRRIRFLFFIPILALASCASYSLIPMPEEGVTIKHTRGEQSLLAAKENMAVAVSAQVYNDLIYFKVIVKNFTDKSIYVDDSRVELNEDAGGTGFSNPVKIYGADEYYQRRKEQIVAGQVMMVMGAAISAMDAGRRTTYVTETYPVYHRGRRGSYYRGFGSYTYRTYTYDYGRAALETEIAFSNVASYVNGTNAELQYLQDTLFYPTDIDANSEYFGIIVAELGEQIDAQMRLNLQFAGTPFTFVFQKSKFEYGE